MEKLISKRHRKLSIARLIAFVLIATAFTANVATAGDPCSEDLVLTAGTENWVLIGLPCDVGAANTVDEVFGNDGLGIYGADWIVRRRDEVNNQYFDMGLMGELREGEGYWLQVLGSATDTPTLTVEGATPMNFPFPDPNPDGGPGGMGLTNDRLNMLGHLFDFSVDVQDVRVHYDDNGDGMATDHTLVQAEADGVLTTSNLFKWNGASYDTLDPTLPPGTFALDPFDGFWVAAGSNPASDGPTFLYYAASGAPLIDPQPQPGWLVRLMAASEEFLDGSNFLGQRPGSSHAFDRNDMPELPPFGLAENVVDGGGFAGQLPAEFGGFHLLEPIDNYLTLVFPHPDWDFRAGNYSGDFHPIANESETWSFEIRSGTPDRTVTLLWEGPRDILRRSRLRDDLTGDVIVPDRTGSYTFRLRGTSRTFTWQVDRDDKR